MAQGERQQDLYTIFQMGSLLKVKWSTQTSFMEESTRLPAKSDFQ
jgi:hypothetical protein